MGFAGYVSVCVQLYYVGFHCLSLHVSAYVAIFKCVENNKEKASRQTHTQGNKTKITKKNSTGKTQTETCSVTT
jgi:hypothetical protein